MGAMGSLHEGALGNGATSGTQIATSSGPKPDLAGRPGRSRPRSSSLAVGRPHQRTLEGLPEINDRYPFKRSGGRRSSVSNRPNPELRHGFATPTICPLGNDSPCRARDQPSVDIKLLTTARTASWGDLCLKPLTGLLGSKVRQSLSLPPESVVELPAPAVYLK